jgi:uncharacterized protein
MSAEPAQSDRIAPTRRPDGRAIGFQTWSDLLFVHWRMPAAEVERHLPDRLTLDTWNGDAWVGLVLFQMSGVRPAMFPPIPGLSSFPEFNVRTYVHHEGRDPGVWFFSLDAASSLAVRVARWKWHLPYYRAAMAMRRNDHQVAYYSERLWPGATGPGVDVKAEFGDFLGGLDKDFPAGEAVPGTLEHFLAERYILYAEAGGRLYRGQVHHPAYSLREATLKTMQESLLGAAGLHPRTADLPDHVMFSEGVKVEIFPLVPI